MVKYDYVPEDKLQPEKGGFYFRDGGYDFEVINFYEGIGGKDDRIEMFLEGCGKSGKKSEFFSGASNKLWKLVSYLKAINRMDLYSEKGLTDLSKTVGNKGYLLLKTKYSDQHKKEFQNIEFVPWNKFMETNDITNKEQLDNSWKEVEDEGKDIPF